MSIITFGDELLRTGDLDPVYVALNKAKLDRRTLLRLSLSYWCFYHLGLAAHLASIESTPKFWSAFEKAVINKDNADGTKDYPRGAERRHFRGANAQAAYKHLRQLYLSPEDAAYGLVEGVGGVAPLTYHSVAKQVQLHTGFGPWIAFKIADMAERVLGFKVDFSDCELGIYKDPRQGAAVGFWEWMHTRGARFDTNFKGNPWDYPITDDELQRTVWHYVDYWQMLGAKAPGGKPRLVNVQEVETIFCKYKSHLKGHYPIGKDTREIRHGLQGWGPLADKLAGCLPK